MIRTIQLELNAAQPDFPVQPIRLFAGSAASLTILNVPRSVGARAVTAISVQVKLRTGGSVTIPATRVGSAWEVTIPASNFAEPYSASLGLKILGSGISETEAPASWILGAADIAVLNAQGEVIPGHEEGGVPVTDVGDLAARYTLADLASKVNSIVHVLAQRDLT